jgi:hypothetical protein
MARSVAEIGRSKKMIGSPREIWSERRRFTSISGPRMKPSTSGTGSHPNFSSTYPNAAKITIMTIWNGSAVVA